MHHRDLVLLHPLHPISNYITAILIATYPSTGSHIKPHRLLIHSHQLRLPLGRCYRRHPPNYSRAYIHPAVSVAQKEPGDFPLSSIHHAHIPRLQLQAVSVGIPYFLIFSLIFSPSPAIFRVSRLPSLFVYICNHRVCFSLRCSLRQPHLAMTLQLSSSAYSSYLGCLIASSSPNAPPELPFNRQPSCSISN